MADGLTRRELLARGTAAGVGLAVIGAGCGCATRKEVPPVVTHGVVPVGKVGDYAAGTVSNAYMAMYGIVISNDAGTITAIRPKCTHKGCIAPWNADANVFVCPCHGSRFDIEGRPVAGPAKKYMARVPAMVAADGGVSVDLDKVYAAEPGAIPAAGA